MPVAASTGGQGNHEGGKGLRQADDPKPGGDGQPCYWHCLRADLTTEGSLSDEINEKEASKDDHEETNVTLVNKLVQNVSNHFYCMPLPLPTPTNHIPNQ